MKTIAANELKTRGVSSIEKALVDDAEHDGKGHQRHEEKAGRHGALGHVEHMLGPDYQHEQRGHRPVRGLLEPVGRWSVERDDLAPASGVPGRLDGEIVGLFVAEIPGDAALAARDLRLHHRRGPDPFVQHDGDSAPDILSGEPREYDGAPPVQLEIHVE